MFDYITLCRMSLEGLEMPVVYSPFVSPTQYLFKQHLPANCDHELDISCMLHTKLQM